MTLRAILAAFAGAIFTFLLGWLVFGILLMDFYTANTTKYEGLMNEMPNLLLMFIGNLVWGFFLAFIFERWANLKSFSRGIYGGIIIGLAFTLVFDLYMLSGLNLFTVNLIVVDIIVNTLVSGLVGGLIGLILGAGKKAYN